MKNIQNGKIAVLQLYHLNGGNRWLLTCGMDKTSKAWDLLNTSEPIQITSKRLHSIDGCWLIHWLGYAEGHDDSSAICKYSK